MSNLSLSTSHITRNNIVNIITAAILLSLFVNCVLFAYYNANPLIKSDGWRFISIYLEPWYSNELSFFDLWKDHHPQPLTAMLFIANSELFNLRMDYEVFFAINFSLLSFIVLYKKYNATLGLNEKKTDTIETNTNSEKLFAVLIALLLFSLTSTAVYTWSLVSIGFIFIFASLIVLLYLDKIIATEFSTAKFVFSTLSISLLLIFFSTAAKIILYSSLFIIVSSFILYKQKKWLLATLPIILAILANSIFQHFSDVTLKYNELNAVSDLSTKIQFIPEYILYIGTGLSSIWLNISAITKKSGVPHAAIYILGFITLTVYTYTLYMYFKNNINKKSIIPGALIMTSFITAFGAALFRFDPETHSALIASTPRYYLVYVLGGIGVIWTWCHIYSQARLSKQIKAIGVAVIFVLISSQLLSSVIAWKKTPSIQKLITETHKTMIINSDGDISTRPPKFMTGNNFPEPYLSSLKTLKKYNLNIFSKDNIVAKHQQRASKP